MFVRDPWIIILVDDNNTITTTTTIATTLIKRRSVWMVYLHDFLSNTVVTRKENNY